MQFLGLSERTDSRGERPWWEDAVPAHPGSVRRNWQMELWSGPEPVKAMEEIVEEPAPLEVELSEPIDAQEEEILEQEPSQKGKHMSMLAIAKYLKINNALYDGNDKRRWLSLPGHKSAAPFRLMKQPALSPDYFKDLRSPSHEFSSMSQRRGDGVITW